MSLRTCKGCGLEAKTMKDLSLFRSSTSSQYGRSNWCKGCANMLQQTRRQKAKFDACILKGGECSNCGIKTTLTNTPIFEFHHLDRSKKEFQLSYNGYSSEKQLEELKKCVLLCSNCHRMEHSIFSEHSWKQS